MTNLYHYQDEAGAWHVGRVMSPVSEVHQCVIFRELYSPPDAPDMVISMHLLKPSPAEKIPEPTNQKEST